MGDPYIKLYKKMLDWEWYDDANTKILFLHCLLKANWKKTSWHGIDLQPGQFITSLAVLSEETHMSMRQVRTAIEHLELTGEVTSKSHSKFRIITIKKWNEHQGIDKQNDKQATSKRQASDKQATTDKEYKEYKNIKNKYYKDARLDKAFQDFMAMRQKIRKPMSEKAIELAKNKLDKLSGGDTEAAIAILNQSILGSWQGLYELKDKKPDKKPGGNTRQYSSEEWAEMERAALGR